MWTRWVAFLLLLASRIAFTDAACYRSAVLGSKATQCYNVDISFCTIAQPGTTCTATNAGYEYYNGVHQNKVDYAAVEVEARHGCDDAPDTCTILVNGVECNACLFDSDSDSVIMEDCSNTPGGFFPNVAVDDGEPVEPLVLDLLEGQSFFPLNDGDKAAFGRCQHVAYHSGPIPVPYPKVTVESTLQLGFFDNTLPRLPTTAEIDALMSQTRLFYIDALSVEYPNLKLFYAQHVDTRTSLAGNFQVTIDFDAVAYFNGTSLSSTELFEALENANYEGTTAQHVTTLFIVS